MGSVVTRTYFLAIAGLLLVVLLAPAARQADSQESAYEASASDQEDPSAIRVVITTAAGEFTVGRKDYKPWLILRDLQGRTVWERTFPQHESGAFAHALTRRAGGFLVGGVTQSQIGQAWIVRLSPNGAILWERILAKDTYGVSAMAPGRNGGVFIAGGASDGVDSARWIASLDDQGKILWQRHFDAQGDRGGVAEQIETVGDGVIVAGQHWLTCACEGYRGGEPWAARLNENGETIWEKTFHAALASDENAPLADFRLVSVSAPSGGVIILSGRAEKFVEPLLNSSMKPADMGGWELRLNDAGEVVAKAFSKPDAPVGDLRK
jgi:hypothetical protein